MRPSQFPDLTRGQAHILERIASYAQQTLVPRIEADKGDVRAVDPRSQNYVDRKAVLAMHERHLREARAIEGACIRRRLRPLDPAERELLEAARLLNPEISGRVLDQLLAGDITLDDIKIALAPVVSIGRGKVAA